MTQTLRTLARLACATAALAFTLLHPAAARAQGPAEDAEEHADEAARPDDGPEAFNTVQQARMKLSSAEREVARADKLDEKAKASKSASEQTKLREKAKESFESAISDYKEALKMDPKLVEAWVGIAGLMAKSAHFELAIETYDKALELAPDDVEAMIGKGHAELAAFKVNEAKASYEKIAAASAKAGHQFIADMRVWLDATRSRLGPEMADAVAQLDSWIKAREKS
jgi:tetratricopeptide (TPR) repeat protein